MPVEIKLTVEPTEGKFDNATWTFPCKKCESPISKTIGWLRQSTEATCPSCGAVNPLNSEEIDAQVKDFERTIQSISEP